MNDMNTHFQNVIASITASNSGELVTGTQRLQDCFKDATSAAGGLQKNYQCFVGKDSAMTSMQTLFAGMYVILSRFFSLNRELIRRASTHSLQQAGGYLPPNLVQDIINSSLSLPFDPDKSLMLTPALIISLHVLPHCRGCHPWIDSHGASQQRDHVDDCCCFRSSPLRCRSVAWCFTNAESLDLIGQLRHRGSTDATMFQRRDHDSYNRSSINLRMCHGR